MLVACGPMAAIIIAGTIEIQEGVDRGELLERTAPLQRATREEEPGCLAYCFAADPVVARRIQVYELWADEAALAAHFRHRYYQEMRAVLRAGGIASADNRKYRVDASEPVYDETGTARADFFSIG